MAQTEKATFGAGCFWGIESAFRELPGVVSATVGYAGGYVPNPSYRDVCTGQTGHAEVVVLEYDPAVTSYEQLLDLFWRIHDPTQLNRQGPDFGTQYRSVVLFHSPQQEAAARNSLTRLESSGRFKRKIVTQLLPATEFWRAEEYHQRYFEKNGLKSCHLPG